MRITNGIINNNTKNNILVNKEYNDRYNTMVATGQKITRPSDDPIVAIRALRLNNNINEINQYYDKNIPDAEAWMEITETALTQTQSVLESVQSNLTQGASDDNQSKDRLNLLENLKALKDQIYASGNADYAGRTVFTGFRTGESLTFMSNETQLFTMVQNFSTEDVNKMTYVSGSYSYDPEKLNEYDPSTYNQTDVKDNEIYRLRLAYEDLTTDQKDIHGGNLDRSLTVTLKDGSTVRAGVSVKSLGNDPEANDRIYTEVGDNEVTLITTTGELILGKNIAAAMRKEGSTTSFEYAKENWKKNDPRPEHYFAAKTYDPDADGGKGREIEYNYDENHQPAFKDQKIQYEIAYNQKIEINVNADEVFSTSIARDVDELVKVTQNTEDAYNKLKKLQSYQSSGTLDPTSQEKIDSLVDAAQKEFDLYKEKMQKMFSQGITTFKDYTDKLNNKLSAVGSLSNRLELTKSRVSDQLNNFKELADGNINAEITETAIDLKNAEMALQAAQQAAATVSKTTLLSYL
ncbi:MAG: hypothetical protein K6G27_04105 [Lachnospiraceae bacterium]|nr:hypothetical protein [Lachnospiraceae bacterium]